MTKMKLI